MRFRGCARSAAARDGGTVAVKLSIHQPHTLGLERATDALMDMGKEKSDWATVGARSFDGLHTIRFDLTVHRFFGDTLIKCLLTVQPESVDVVSENELPDVVGNVVQWRMGVKLAAILK